MLCDLFCTVIDNYGDIGVSWRLARQLVREHGVAVRLWVDDLAAFQRLRPEIDATLDCQRLAGVEVRRWAEPLPEVEPGDGVIEALACRLPEAFLARMAAREPAPVWINLEYLTAEDWADGVHGLPSPHPRWPLTQQFFVPGFSPATGGLTRERELAAARRAFQADVAAQARFWCDLGVPERAPDELRISLFCYENAALPGLLDALAAGRRPVRLLTPVGKALPEIAAWLGADAPPQPGAARGRGALTLHVLPMLDQDAYDRLLWACDINAVRGEDSFLRAQFAARPMFWQAYRQDEGAHFTKLEAFLARYCAAMPAAEAEVTRALWRAWNAETPVGECWAAWLARLDGLRAQAETWCEALEKQPDLASKLMIFCEKVMKTAQGNG